MRPELPAPDESSANGKSRSSWIETTIGRSERAPSSRFSTSVDAVHDRECVGYESSGRVNYDAPLLLTGEGDDQKAALMSFGSSASGILSRAYSTFEEA